MRHERGIRRLFQAGFGQTCKFPEFEVGFRVLGGFFRF